MAQLSHKNIHVVDFRQSRLRRSGFETKQRIEKLIVSWESDECSLYPLQIWNSLAHPTLRTSPDKIALLPVKNHQENWLHHR